MPAAEVPAAETKAEQSDDEAEDEPEAEKAEEGEAADAEAEGVKFEDAELGETDAADEATTAEAQSILDKFRAGQQDEDEDEDEDGDEDQQEAVAVKAEEDGDDDALTAAQRRERAIASLPASPAPSAWDAFSLHPLLLHALEAMGFSKPTPVQSACLDAAITHWKDVIAASETGSGKVSEPCSRSQARASLAAVQDAHL